MIKFKNLNLERNTIPFFATFSTPVNKDLTIDAKRVIIDHTHDFILTMIEQELSEYYVNNDIIKNSRFAQYFKDIFPVISRDRYIPYLVSLYCAIRCTDEIDPPNVLKKLLLNMLLYQQSIVKNQQSCHANLVNRIGNGNYSAILINDKYLIKEMRIYPDEKRLQVAQAIADALQSHNLTTARKIMELFECSKSFFNYFLAISGWENIPVITYSEEEALRYYSDHWAD